VTLHTLSKSIEQSMNQKVKGMFACAALDDKHLAWQRSSASRQKNDLVYDYTKQHTSRSELELRGY
jgi:hypothetical protein